MLREIRPVAQRPGEPRRRWFSDTSLDLTVWYCSDGAVAGFQLCYGKPHRERALTWWAGGELEHARVDAGEEPAGSHKRSPILLPAAPADLAPLWRELEPRAAALEPALLVLLRERLLPV